ncbi:MAG: SPOR domain-containing protein [Flavobacteriales bacterium]|nr:SPOR domain-containing protein [Flavobacteriales bacterium]
MSLERDLHDLLYEHDCVIVPGWGGFLAQYKPARLDTARKVIHPPCKEVGFNRHLMRNDGLLTDQLAKRDGLAFTAASDLLAQEVAHWRAELDRQGRLELPRIGIFYRDAERNLQFDPDDRANFLKEAFGLRPVAAIPRVQQEKPTVVEPIAVPAATGRRWNWAAAAGIALLISAGAIGSYLFRSEGDALAWLGRPDATYMPEHMPEAQGVTASGVLLPEEPLGIRTLPLSDNDSVSLTVDLGSPAPAETTYVAPTTKSTTLGRFHIIGGCFAQPENADRLLSDLLDRGFPAQRLSQYGELHPVAFGSYPDRASALVALARIREEGAGQAWLLVR